MEFRRATSAELAEALSAVVSRELGRPIRFDANNIERSAPQRERAQRAWDSYHAARLANRREKSRRHAANQAARAEHNRQMRFARGGKAKAR